MKSKNNSPTLKERINNVARGLLPYAIIAFLLGLAFEQTPYRITYNITLSVPKGFYLYEKGNRNITSHDDYVIFQYIGIPPYVGKNKYVDLHWTHFIKQPLGMPGDRIITKDYVNYRIEGDKLIELNKAKKELPVVQNFDGSPLPKNKYFMGSHSDIGFDSRYFGLVDRNQIIGKAWLLWEVDLSKLF